MSTLWNDVRYSLRRLRKSPGFTAVVVLILAVSIGADIAIFSVVNAVLLRPLPYADSQRLTILMEQTETPGIEIFTTYDRFRLWRERSQVFEQMSGYIGCRPYVAGIDRPRYYWAAQVLPDLFGLLGVQPALGRGFYPEEDRPGKDRVVVLSHAFWRNDMGGTPDVIGRTITINEESYAVVGVMPANFNFPIGQQKAFWVPLVYGRDPLWPGGGVIFGVAKLKKDETIEHARAEMTVISKGLEQDYPEAGGITVRGLLDRKLGGNRRLLWLLLGAAGLVLLIACTNVASLLLARSATRRRDVAVRLALGASRGRLIQQRLSESLLLSLTGGTLGLLLAVWMIEGIIHLCPADIPRLMETSVDRSVLLFMLAVSILMGLLFGIMPTCGSCDVCVGRTLKEEETRSSTGRQWRRLHAGLVVVQTALSVVLLIGAALLVRTWVTLQNKDLGFRPEGVATVSISLLESTYPEGEDCRRFFDSLLERVQALPDVRSVAVTPYLDFGMDVVKFPLSIAGQIPDDPENGPFAKRHGVTPGFFATLGMRLLKGRTFTEEDLREARQSVIVDENLVRRCFGDADPIGRKIGIRDADYTIVGVVSTLRDFEHLDPAVGTVFRPIRADQRDMTLLVRTTGDPLHLISVIRSQTAQIAEDEIITGVGTLKADLHEMLAPRRFSVVLLGLFGGIALSLAAAGTYGLLQYSTVQQTRDIGIRMALGARATDILQAVVRQGLMLTFVGMIVGLAGAMIFTRILSSLLYGVTPTDPLVFVAVALILTGVALLASWLPARRAARIDPMEALRHE